MDQVEFVKCAWIPFANQNNAIVKLYTHFPKFIEHLNRQITELNIPVAFDYENEVTNDVIHFFETTKPIGSYLRLWEYQKVTVARYRNQRLVHLTPTRIHAVNGVLGVEFKYHGSLEDNLWLPKTVKVVGNFYPEKTDDFRLYNTFNAKQLSMAMYGTTIYSFIVEPFN